MLKNYSCLKGVVSKDLEDHIRRTCTHHNFIVQANKLDYQVNIDTQSDDIPNVKVYYTEELSNELLGNLDTLENEGMFSLDPLSYNFKLDYLRNKILPVATLKNIAPKTWQKLSTLLDEYITYGSKLWILGEYYDDNAPPHLTYGLRLRQEHNHLPPIGIHNIHMNQGSSLTTPHGKSNGIYQDGAIFVQPCDKFSQAFFFIFSEQSLNTDNAGNPI